jgi:tetratricopeptide (TPR) repeat protein
VAGDLLDRALVIVAGDHGEALGEHGEPTHGILLYEATTRVPLLVHMPGQTEAARHQGPVGLVDIAPTIREMIGIEGAADGVSLLPTLREKSKIAGDRALYIESLEGYLRNGWAPVFAVVRENWKYIDSPRPELYDLAADPGERHDLAAERPRVGADLARRLAAIRPSGESFAGPAITLSPDEEAALLALGYVTGAPGEAAGSRRNPADAIHLAAVHEQALEAKARGDLDEAVKLFKTELEQDPSSPVLLWYVGSCEAASNPDRAARRFRRAIELRPGFEAPYIALAELLLERGAAGQAAATATAGIGATFDADGRLHYLRAAAASPAGGGIDEVMRDLAIAIERAARPGPAYLLRAEIRLERLDDLDGALADLESFADWSTPQEVERLPTDPRFEKLHNEPRFGILVGRWLARADR